jgi:putative ABC transport system substrate-binding protein
MRDLGYVIGKNLVIEPRFADGNNARLAVLATQLVQLNVDVIVSTAIQPSLAAKEATATIPVVFAGAEDPVAWGLVKSLARPGANVTGVTNFSPELSGKRVELLKEAIPRISRIAVLRDSRQPPQSFNETEKAARSLGIALQSLEIRNATNIDNAFATMRKEHADAFISLPQTVITIHRKHILELTKTSRLPSVYGDKAWTEGGGLMSYGPDTMRIDRRAAIYVDKILKGAKPADLPVEQPTKFELVINLKTAKQIGLTIPPNMLARADRVIR